ncbi:MAG: hypothetical protein K8I60_18935 [Anaerolineae bacterium]|nr:hypothetical protein [Anaerolineae bacterium]
MSYYRRRRPQLLNRTICLRLKHDHYTHVVVSSTPLIIGLHYGVVHHRFKEMKSVICSTLSDPDTSGVWDGHGYDLKKLAKLIRKRTPNY